MPVDFPGSPTSGQVFSVGGSSWRYNGYAWARIPDPGEKGQKGQKGDKGEKGEKGQKGDKGIQGNFGGATFDYTFSASTGTPTDLNTGRLRLNNSSVSSATVIFIDDEDDNGTDIQPFLRTIDDSTSTIKGHVRISNKLNADDFALFTISSTTEQSGFHQISVGYVSGSATSFTNGEDIIVTFARTGDQGQKGERGIQGIQGVQDKIFEGDTEAEVVDTGGNGHFKVTTEGTERFKIDNVGLATFTNDVVISNNLFLNKTVNAICKIDHDGGNLDLHADGNVRFFESDGNTLMFTFDVDTTNDDARLILEDDTDTFFNHPDNNQLGFTAGGTETIRIKAGKVGIKNNSPTTALDVTGNIRAFFDANNNILLNPDDGSIELTRSNGAFIDFATSGTEDHDCRIKQEDDGLAFTTGGQGSATEKLRIKSDGQLNLAGNMQFTAANPELEFNDGGPRFRVPAANTLTIHTGGGLGSTDNERFRIGSSGQLGLSGANYGTSGQVLTSQGGSSAPIWNSIPAAVTYDLITSSVGSNVQLLLDASTGDDDPILITAGTNVSFAGVSATGFTINTVDTNTTYDLGTADGDNTSEEKIQLIGSDSTTDSVILAVSTGLSIARDTTSGKITLTNTDTGSGSNTFIGLTDTPSSFTANKTLKVNGAGNAVIFADDNNTTFALSAADGDTTTQEKIVLTGTNPTSTDNVILEVSTGLSIARTGNTITFANTAPDTNTTYLLKAQQTGGNDTNPNLLLDASGSGTDDTVQLVGSGSVTVERNTDGQITITGTDTNTDTDTTYDLITSQSGSNVILKLDASAGDDDPVTITAGTNVSLTENGSGTGFTIATTGTLTGTADEANKVKITTASNSEYHNITFVPIATTNNSYQTLEIDSQDNQLAYNPSLNRIKTTGIQLSRVYTSGGSAGSSGQLLTSGGNSGNFTWTDADAVGTDTNTTYQLSTSANGDDINIILDPSTGTDDVITIRNGDNVSFTNVSSTEFTINTSATLDVTQLNLRRIRFGPGNATNDDANIEWLGGTNDGYLRISTSDDGGAEYIELGDYDFVDASTASGNTFTRWMKLNRSELYMDRHVRLNGELRDKDGQGGSNGQVLTSTGSQVNWVDSSSVGQNTQLSKETVQDYVGEMLSGNTETRIQVSYDDAANKINFVVDDMSGDTNTTYSAGSDYGMALSGTEFRLKDDRRRNSTSTDVRSGNTHDYTFYDASHGIRWYTTGSEEMRLENDGDLHVDGDIIAFSTTISDIRLKKDLQIIQNPLDIINKINGYTFTYKKDNKKSAGVVAQEVEKVFPQAVSEKGLPFSSEDEENPDNYKTVEYDQIVGLLVQAVKELTDKVKKLEGR